LERDINNRADNRRFKKCKKKRITLGPQKGLGKEAKQKSDVGLASYLSRGINYQLFDIMKLG